MTRTTQLRRHVCQSDVDLECSDPDETVAAAIGLISSSAALSDTDDINNSGDAISTTATNDDALASYADAAGGAVGMIRKSSSQKDERRKRSTAYNHTEPYKQIVDAASGVEFDVRSCKYCDAVFSFRGGTTSATLRHLKSAHPQEFFERNGSVEVEGDGDDGEQDEQLHLEDGELLARCKATNHHVKGASSSKKRRRYDDDSYCYTAGKSPRLTPNQHAITHVLAHYKEELLDVPTRLAFVKHLTYNDREAEMYNVLDDETRLAYVTQFAAQYVTTDAAMAAPVS